MRRVSGFSHDLAMYSEAGDVVSTCKLSWEPFEKTRFAAKETVESEHAGKGPTGTCQVLK